MAKTTIGLIDHIEKTLTLCCTTKASLIIGVTIGKIQGWAKESDHKIYKTWELYFKPDEIKQEKGTRLKHMENKHVFISHKSKP